MILYKYLTGVKISKRNLFLEFLQLQIITNKLNEIIRQYTFKNLTSILHHLEEFEERMVSGIEMRIEERERRVEEREIRI